MGNIYSINTTKKSKGTDYRDPRSRHLEEWKKLSCDARDKALGETIFKEAEDLYTLKNGGSMVPSFRPTVTIPELQKICFEDANKLSDLTPQPYIFSSGERVKDREEALQAEWQRARVNYHLMFAALQARYIGVGFLQLCYSPDLNHGDGALWVKARDPKTVGMDPSSDYEFDPSFIYFEDWMNLEEVRKRWPDTSRSITPFSGVPPTGMDSGFGIQMPPGPMQSTPGMGTIQNSKSTVNGNMVLVTHCFCKDYTREIVEEKDLPDGALTDPEFQWKYPNGRWLVECDGYILSDGDNPFPMRTDINVPTFPLFPIWALPPLYGPWGVPVTHLSLNLQTLAEKMHTQIFENAVRMNNSGWAIETNSGIDIENFGGMPGEVVQINPNTKPPQPFNGSNAMNAQAYKYPNDLLDMQRRLHGITPAREGNPGAGNISTDLFDASVLQSSGLLQLSGRMQYGTLTNLMTAMYRTMCQYIPSRKIPYRASDGMTTAEWKGLLRPDQHHDIYLDEDSVKPLSDAVIRKMAPELMKTGVLNTKRGLEILNFPGADEIAQEQKEQQELAALARVKGSKR